jgi:hypothetical protein
MRSHEEKEKRKKKKKKGKSPFYNFSSTNLIQ